MLRRFWLSRDGNYAAIFAIAAVPLMASIAGIVDFANTANKASQLQNSLDTAALAIGTQYMTGMSNAELQVLGEKYFAPNMEAGMSPEGTGYVYVDQTGAFAVEATDEAQSSLVSVTSKITLDPFIGSDSTWHATRRADVRIVPGKPACVLALDPDASDSVKIQGTSQVTFEGCVIASNSNADDAVSRGGSALISADCVSTVGGTEGFSGSYADLDCGQPLEGQYKSFDPLAKIGVPTTSGCNKSVPAGNNKTLTPGTYCNQTFQGTMTLEPGVYVLNGGKVQLNGNDLLTGTNVAIVLTNGAEFTTNGNAVLKLSPPTSGTYAGIAIYQAAGNTKTISINGSMTSTVDGFIYAPSAHVFYAGSSSTSGAGECIRIVGNTIEMTGNADISSDCAAILGGTQLQAGRHVSLVR